MPRKKTVSVKGYKRAPPRKKNGQFKKWHRVKKK
jgi:hypothetical protein